MKPAHEGSTLGITKVRTAADLAPAVAFAATFDPLVIVEEFVEGQELTAAILGDEALPLVRIEAPGGNYDYQNKYFTDDTKYHCPAGVRPDVEAAIRRDALAAFRVLGCRGWGRADVMLRADGTYSFLEMNTSPGMTGHSLVPIAARAVGHLVSGPLPSHPRGRGDGRARHEARRLALAAARRGRARRRRPRGRGGWLGYDALARRPIAAVRFTGDTARVRGGRPRAPGRGPARARGARGVARRPCARR